MKYAPRTTSLLPLSRIHTISPFCKNLSALYSITATESLSLQAPSLLMASPSCLVSQSEDSAALFATPYFDVHDLCMHTHVLM
jgi:hypothetical protein